MIMLRSFIVGLLIALLLPAAAGFDKSGRDANDQNEKAVDDDASTNRISPRLRRRVSTDLQPPEKAMPIPDEPSAYSKSDMIDEEGGETSTFWARFLMESTSMTTPAPTPVPTPVPTLSPSEAPSSAPSDIPSNMPSDGGPFCIDFECEEGFMLRENPETRVGDDRATCCFREGVCAGVPVNGTCALGDIGASLIPNPSFENFTSCPTTFSQLSLAVTWVQATGGTSDYWVGGPSCPDSWRSGLGGIGQIPQEATDGDAFVGSIKLSTNNYYEYVGACLNSPLLAGTPYTFNLDIAAATDSANFGGDTNGATELLCVPNCDEFQIPGFDYKGDNYEVLATAEPVDGLIGGGEWKSITFEVNPTKDCPAVMFGPGLAQTIQSGERGSYVIYDFLNLQEGMAGVCNADGECVPAA